jgi:hypothetical protein
MVEYVNMPVELAQGEADGLEPGPRRRAVSAGFPRQLQDDQPETNASDS